MLHKSGRVYRLRLLTALLTAILPLAVAWTDEPAASAAPDEQESWSRQRIVELLVKVNEATRNLRAFRFRGKLERRDGEGVTLYTTTAAAALQPDANTTFLMFEYEGHAHRLEGQRQTYVLNDHHYLKANWAERRLWIHKQPVDPKEIDGDLPNYSWVRELVHPAPFEHEINAPRLEHEGYAYIGETRCHVVRVEYRLGMEARWFFAIDTLLPRRIERLRRWGGNVDMVTTLVELDTDPDFDTRTFYPTFPEDFKRDVREPDSRLLRAEGRVLPAGAPAVTNGLGRANHDPIDSSIFNGKISVLVFWVDWAEPCEQALRDLAHLQSRIDDARVQCFAVYAASQGGVVPQQWLREHRIALATWVANEVALKSYKIKAYPTIYVIGPEGEIVGAFWGAKRMDRIQQLIANELHVLKDADSRGE